MKYSGSNWEVIFGGLFLFLTHKYQGYLGKLVVEFLKQNSLTFGATFGVNLCLFLDCFWCICYALKKGTVLHNLWMLWHSFEYFILICNCWKYWFFGWIKFGANCNYFRCISYLLLQIGYHCVCWNFWADLSPVCWKIIHVSLPLNTGQFEHLSCAFYSGNLAQVLNLIWCILWAKHW